MANVPVKTALGGGVENADTPAPSSTNHDFTLNSNYSCKAPVYINCGTPAKAATTGSRKLSAVHVVYLPKNLRRSAPFPNRSLPPPPGPKENNERAFIRRDSYTNTGAQSCSDYSATANVKSSSKPLTLSSSALIASQREAPSSAEASQTQARALLQHPRQAVPASTTDQQQKQPVGGDDLEISSELLRAKPRSTSDIVTHSTIYRDKSLRNIPSLPIRRDSQPMPTMSNNHSTPSTFVSGKKTSPRGSGTFIGNRVSPRGAGITSPRSEYISSTPQEPTAPSTSSKSPTTPSRTPPPVPAGRKPPRAAVGRSAPMPQRPLPASPTPSRPLPKHRPSPLSAQQSNPTQSNTPSAAQESPVSSPSSTSAHTATVSSTPATSGTTDTNATPPNAPSSPRVVRKQVDVRPKSQIASPSPIPRPKSPRDTVPTAILKPPISITLDLSTIDESEHRNRIAKEIITTEISYVSSLGKVVTYFLKPIREAVGTENEILPPACIPSIFSNIETICTFNTELLRSLKLKLSEWSSTSTLGDVFLALTPYLKVYTQYANNYDHAISVYNKMRKTRPQFKRFLAEQKKNSELGKLDLEDYLIMPIQRIPRYNLLLADLIKHTERHHLDYENLNAALTLMKQVATQVNNSCKTSDNLAKLVKIQQCLVGSRVNIVQPSRVFIREGPVTKITSRTTRNQYIFLFNDLLIFARKYIFHQFKFKGSIALVHTFILDMPNADGYENVFKIQSPKKTYTVFVKTTEDKQAWMKAINDTRDQLMEIEGAKMAYRLLQKAGALSNSALRTTLSNNKKKLPPSRHYEYESLDMLKAAAEEEAEELDKTLSLNTSLRMRSDMAAASASSTAGMSGAGSNADLLSATESRSRKSKRLSL